MLLLPVVCYATEFNSFGQTSVMVELYTSEGCSSCPPAENYLNKLKADERLWKTLFPMAFHVDYWDDLGWKDRFSHAEYSARQKKYASYYKNSTVFTPAYFVNGENWRPGFYNNALPVKFIDNTGLLNLVIRNNSLVVRYTADAVNRQALVLNTVVLGMGLTTDITRGENAGRLAKHEFVVLDYSASVSSQPEWQLTLPAIAFQGETQRALIAWVTREDNPRPLQIAGGLLENNIQHGHGNQ